jgi:DeoD family purine-nucleoside phosphorylase
LDWVAPQTAATIHIQPTADLAERVLLPGDPGRALSLAQVLLTEPKMFNHNRGLWGYTGTGVDGDPLTIQSTGMGGPSAAIVISELIELGARRLIRVGTCGAVAPSLTLGDLVIATHALAEDGTSRALGAGESIAGSAELKESLTRAAGERAVAGAVVSSDLFYDGPDGRELHWLELGALAVEMETSTLFALAARRGIAAGSLLAVSDVLLPARIRIDPDALGEAERRMGEIAAAALR